MDSALYLPDTDPVVPMPDYPDDWTVASSLFSKPVARSAETLLKSPVVDMALKYADSGLSIFPCVLPGKYPMGSWLQYQDEGASKDEISRWYAKHPEWGCGIVCGEVSGGLEVIDLDGGDFANEFEGLIKSNAPGLLDKLVIEISDHGGVHYGYLCDEGCGNSVLAKTSKSLPGHKPGADGMTTLIETRGRGGFIVVFPTPNYKLRQGDWLNIQTITADERNILWNIAATLSEKEAPKKGLSAAPLPPPTDEHSQKTAELHELLEERGWVMVKTAKGREEWRRPGKDVGISATWNYIEDSLYVFSSNAAPFLDNHRYTIRQVRQLLKPESVPLKDRPISEACMATDMGNAQRFSIRFSDSLRYSSAWGWMIWNGRFWEMDDGGSVMQAAQHTARMIFDEARDAKNPADAKTLGKWALSSQSRSKLDAMIGLAKDDLRLVVKAEQFDSSQYILNTQGGIVDLKTGALSAHDPDALLSKITSVSCNYNAGCPKWLKFLNRIMGGNQDLIGFLQRAVGYSLTGSTTEQCFFLLHGSGANGKSVFLETIRAILKDYATVAEFSTFLARQNETVRNDIATLAGARFVASSESGADKRLSETIIKALTGGDTISARFLFKEYFQFKPQFKVWMATNHKPVIRDTDHAIWRRVRLVPFTVTIPKEERDPHLLDSLRDEHPAILAWAVRGCMDWVQNGLGKQAEVENATEEYRSSMDVLESFFEDCCVRGDDYSCGATAIYGRYSNWCEANNEKPMTQREFGLRLGEKGFAKEHARTGSKWTGIGVLEEN